MKTSLVMENSRMKIACGLALGGIMGGSTLALEQLSTISENQILGEAQKGLFDLLLPGIICSMGIGGNVHAWHLWIAACINGLIYFGVGWFLYKTVVRLRRIRKPLILLAVVILSGISARAQISEADGFNDAKRLYASGQFLNAEKGFANIVREHPDDVAAQMYLGQTLFHEEKYADAVVPYEKVRSLEKRGMKLTMIQHRILVDQLAMAYGVSGRTADSKLLLQESVRGDPDYPLNYYNLACVAADENDKPAILKNLTLAFQHRGQVLPGEQMPNPASDPSFQKYAQDSDFKALVSRLKN